MWKFHSNKSYSLTRVLGCQYDYIMLVEGLNNKEINLNKSIKIESEEKRQDIYHTLDSNIVW